MSEPATPAAPAPPAPGVVAPPAPPVPPAAPAAPVVVPPAAPVAPPAPVVPPAPITYALTKPEGNVHIDDTDLEAVKALATANHWTNDEAQAELTARGAAMVSLSTKFLEQTKADAEYGGPKFAETERLAQLALQTLRPKGTPRGWDTIRKKALCLYG